MDKIGVIGVPYNTGSKGINIEMGAEALRKAGVVDMLRGIGEVVDFGDLMVNLPPADVSNPRLLRPNQVEALCRALAAKIESIVKAGCFPFIIGGGANAFVGAGAVMFETRGVTPGAAFIIASSVGMFAVCESAT